MQRRIGEWWTIKASDCTVLVEVVAGGDGRKVMGGK
jgi:hypothetical protein